MRAVLVGAVALTLACRGPLNNAACANHQTGWCGEGMFCSIKGDLSKCVPMDAGSVVTSTDDAAVDGAAGESEVRFSCRDCNPAAGAAICDEERARCVGCLDDSNCGTTKPICDKELKVCRQCRADSECQGGGPGICVDWDGHCAGIAEVVVLQGGAGCVPLENGFCKAADAVAALTKDRDILLIRGPEAVAHIDPPVTAPTRFLIVGRSDANVGAGVGDQQGILAPAGHSVWVRDLLVSGGTLGIFAEPSSEVHLRRCHIVKNRRGGIKTLGAAFEITNSIVAENTGGMDDNQVAFGGIRLGAVPPGGLASFENNTVVNNDDVGVSCATPYDLNASIVRGNRYAEMAGCVLTSCCGRLDPDPVLDANFHLEAGSPCIDKVSATQSSVPFDIDGDLRPFPAAGKLDCGADEFVPP
jgi:hypothetical protein